MINLASEKEADEYIREELREAGIPRRAGKRNLGEVPYSVSGRLGNWRFRRAWYYWIADAPDGKGLPLEIAASLHERAYPVHDAHAPKIYGEVIRVVGHCGCPHPREWAFPPKNVLQIQKTDESVGVAIRMRFGHGFEDLTYRELAECCDTGIIKGTRFVNTYHINDQPGLNEFARVVRELNQR